MKPLYLLLALLPAVFTACQKKLKVAFVPTTADYNKGFSFLDKQNDSAFYYFNKVATTAKDSVLIAMAYNRMASIQSDAGDYYGSQESLLTSLHYLNEQDDSSHWCLASDYNELGTTSLNLKNYDAAIEYYDLALKFSHYEEFRTNVLNNEALTYQKIGKYKEAIAIYETAIGQRKKEKKDYVRILSNLARTRWLQDPGYQAAPDLLTALQVRMNEMDLWGMNASYAHLSDYYAKSRPDSALIYANRMYEVARQLNSPDDEMEALQKLISLDLPKALKAYFIRYQFLSDSIQTSRNAAKNQFALIRYEAEKHKAENLTLQKENAEKTLMILALVAVVVLIAWWYRRRKKQIAWQAENAIQEQQYRTSQKVHDVVANGIYQIINEIEHGDAIDKEDLLDKLDVVYSQSRDISYEQPAVGHNEFEQTITELLESFGTGRTRIGIAGNNKRVLSDLSDRVKTELKQVLRELMVNMDKHSKAENVAVKFERQDAALKIQYSDDGIGLSPAFEFGNGLTSTENRIKGIGGRITFDKKSPKGLKIQIFIPIE